MPEMIDWDYLFTFLETHDGSISFGKFVDEKGQGLTRITVSVHPNGNTFSVSTAVASKHSRGVSPGIHHFQGAVTLAVSELERQHPRLQLGN